MSTILAARPRRKLGKPSKPPVNMTVLAALLDPVTPQQVSDAFVAFGWAYAVDLNDPPDLEEVQRRYDAFSGWHQEQMEPTYTILERFLLGAEKGAHARSTHSSRSPCSRSYGTLVVG